MTKLSDPSVLLLGEAVVDLISSEKVESLEDAAHFHRFAGGQVSNLAMNLARLGFNASLGACIGDDGFGRFLHNRYSNTGVNLGLIQTTSKAPTTLIPVSHQFNTPDFSIYRGADSHLTLNNQLIAKVSKVQALHTSAFALSRDPCRSTIIELMQSAAETDLLISLDPNYHPDIWPDIPDYKEFLGSIFKLVTITKPSIEDSIRYFGPGLEPTDYLEKYLELGPKIVVLTNGENGAYLGNQQGEIMHIKANQVPVMDVTGAGDAFWSGLLIGLLVGMSPAESAQLGQAIAEYKIGFLGPVERFPDLEEFKERADQIQVLPLK